MQNAGQVTLYSASDLVAFMGCKHLTTLDLRKLRGWDERRAEPDAASKLVQDYGNRHELAYLEKLKASGKSVVEIDKKCGVAEQIALTRKAMTDGVDVIFQATLRQDPFLGYADFLLRVDGASKLGNYHYEVADTKLAKSNRAKFMVQLCLYADLLAAEQGVVPEYLHVVLGTLDDRDREKRGMAPAAENAEKLRTRDYIHYVRSIKENFLTFLSSDTPTQPVPVSNCGQCGWKTHCSDHWESVDHLSRVANIRSTQVAKLEAAGVKTMAALAQFTGDIKGVGTLPKLKRQAELQCRPLDERGQKRIEFLPSKPDTPSGFQLLPRPNPGDLYFDMEGFPHEPGGLEYLFGVGYFESGNTKKFSFKPFWAHTRAQEKEAFEAFMDFVEQRLNNFPDAHIYHYAPYEKTAIQKLSSIHNTRTEMRDRLLREGRLVDLYRVVASGLLLAIPSYSIKKVESYYRGKREGDVANAGDSIVQYEAYRTANDAEVKAKLLKDIESYNFDDVESTWQLHQWLESIKPADTVPFQAPPVAPDEEAKRKANRDEREAKEKAALLCLEEWVSRKPVAEQKDAQKVAELLGQLLGFYWRCDLPKLWRKFERQAQLQEDEAELLNDPECLAMLEFTGEKRPENRSVRYYFRVPDQETKLFTGSTVNCLTDGKSASNFEFDQDEQIASFTRLAKSEPPPAILTLCNAESISTKTKLESIYRFITGLGDGSINTSAVMSLLGRTFPKLRDKTPGEAVFNDASPAAVTEVIRALETSHLVIQGPPGTGKTTTASKVIAALLADGKSVGITSNSHSAINNLLSAAYKNAMKAGLSIHAAVVKSDDSLPTGIAVIDKELIDSKKHKLVGGTAWLFCREEQQAQWDYLFVDEASQVSLADVVAAGACAKNIVLLGDQMQLPQPTQGIHPGDSGLSALDYLMQDHATVPANKGIFLGLTYRMHPAVCQPVSQGVYEGRLCSADTCSSQQLVLNADADAALKPNGIVYLPVHHAQCSQSSTEEIDRIQALYGSLLKQSWTTSEGITKPITATDILIVAPYNAQVRELRMRLGDHARIGTVDKFQGQEAAVAIVSMTTSDADNMPRGLDFLFSKNRLNVAVSRAKCLAIIVASPGLKTVECNRMEDMPLLNFYSMLIPCTNLNSTPFKAANGACTAQH